MIYMNKRKVNTVLPNKNCNVTRVTTCISGVYDLHDPYQVSNEIQLLQYVIQSVVTVVFSEYRAVIKYDHNDVW